MKILALGLIHKNNTDNQPIEYVYRTLIILFRLQHIPVTSFLSPSCCPLAGTCFISYRLFFCRYIHLVTACRIIRFRHFQHPCGKHRIDIDIHHVFSGFEVQILHYIKQRFRLDAELQNLLFSQILLIGLS